MGIFKTRAATVQIKEVCGEGEDKMASSSCLANNEGHYALKEKLIWRQIRISDTHIL